MRDVEWDGAGAYWRPSGDHSLRGSEAVFAAVTRLADTLASTPLHLYRGYERATDHPLEELVAVHPSPGMTTFAFLQQLESCRCTNGNGYALKVCDASGALRWLDVLEPTMVQPLRERSTGETWYRISPPDGQVYFVHNHDMLHVQHVSAGGLAGVSPIKVLSDTLSYDDHVREFSLKQLSGVSSCVVLSIPSDLGDAKQKRIVETFWDKYSQSRGGVVVATGGMQVSSIERSAVDPKVLDVDRVTTNRVARVYGMSPSMLGDYSKSSYSSQEQSMLEFLTLTMAKVYRMYETQLNLKLLPVQMRAAGYEYRFDREALLVADTETRTAYYQSAIRTGYMLINEVRAKEGRAPVPGGDVPMVSKDLVPLEQMTKGEILP